MSCVCVCARAHRAAAPHSASSVKSLYLSYPHIHARAHTLLCTVQRARSSMTGGPKDGDTEVRLWLQKRTIFHYNLRIFFFGVANPVAAFPCNLKLKCERGGFTTRSGVGTFSVREICQFSCAIAFGTNSFFFLFTLFAKLFWAPFSFQYELTDYSIRQKVTPGAWMSKHPFHFSVNLSCWSFSGAVPCAAVPTDHSHVRRCFTLGYIFKL